jgi:hypothetical protein
MAKKALVMSDAPKVKSMFNSATKSENCIFVVRTNRSPRINDAYEKAMRDLSSFFEVSRRPRILLADERTLYDLSDWKPAPPGWVEYPNVFILRKIFSSEERMHMVHETAHLFFLACAKMQLNDTDVSPSPIWLWEGVSMFVSGQIMRRSMRRLWDTYWEGGAVTVSGQIIRRSMKRPSKFGDFLNYYDRWTLSGREQPDVFWESGFAVEFLVKNYGRKKLLELIRSVKDANTQKLFAKRFKEIYGFELSYDNFNNPLAGKTLIFKIKVLSIYKA